MSESNIMPAVTVFDKDLPPKSYDLEAYGKGEVYIGRTPAENDIVLEARLVSGTHARFRRVMAPAGPIWVLEDKSNYGGKPSTNGLLTGGERVPGMPVIPGRFARIDNRKSVSPEGALLLFTMAGCVLQDMDISMLQQVTLGQDENCTMPLQSPGISRYHAIMQREGDEWVIADNASANGLWVNDYRVTGKYPVKDRDVIRLADVTAVYSGGHLYFSL